MKTDDVLEVVERYPFEIWCFNRRLTLTEGARLAGVAQQVLARALMPATHKDFREASLRTRRAVRKLTEGEVGLDDWPEPLAPIGGAGLPPTEGRQFSPEGADISHRAAPCETQPSGAS